MEKEKQITFTLAGYPIVLDRFRNEKEISGLTWNDFISVLLDDHESVNGDK